MTEKAIIVKIPSYVTICPYCKKSIFQDSEVNMYTYRKRFEKKPCPECGETISLGKVENW